MLKTQTVQRFTQQGKSPEDIAKITGAKLSNVKLHLKKIVLLPELDTLTDHLISLIERAKESAILTTENNTLKNKNAALRNELQLLHEKYLVKEQQQARYRVAIQQGDIKS